MGWLTDQFSVYQEVLDKSAEAEKKEEGNKSSASSNAFSKRKIGNLSHYAKAAEGDFLDAKCLFLCLKGEIIGNGKMKQNRAYIVSCFCAAQQAHAQHLWTSGKQRLPGGDACNPIAGSTRTLVVGLGVETRRTTTSSHRRTSTRSMAAAYSGAFCSPQFRRKTTSTRNPAPT